MADAPDSRSGSFRYGVASIVQDVDFARRFQLQGRASRSPYHRFVAESAVAGWQSVTITLSNTDDYLVEQAEEFAVGLIFLVIPVGGKATSWYRFRRERE